jgi:hypothetical protein
MKPSSEKRLQQLHPALASAVHAVIADLADRGTVVEVVQGLRTFEEQDELFAKGRTKPGSIVTQARGGQSNHNYGLAADLCPFINDKPDWNAPMAVWAAIGASAAAHGLEWGGQWKKFLDKPHVQLPVMTVKECASCYQAGGLGAVWSTASKKIGWADAPREAARPARKRQTRATTVRKQVGRATAKKRAAPVGKKRAAPVGKKRAAPVGKKRATNVRKKRERAAGHKRARTAGASTRRVGSRRRRSRA